MKAPTAPRLIEFFERMEIDPANIDTTDLEGMSDDELRAEIEALADWYFMVNLMNTADRIQSFAQKKQRSGTVLGLVEDCAIHLAILENLYGIDKLTEINANADHMFNDVLAPGAADD